MYSNLSRMQTLTVSYCLEELRIFVFPRFLKISTKLFMHIRSVRICTHKTRNIPVNSQDEDIAAQLFLWNEVAKELRRKK